MVVERLLGAASMCALILAIAAFNEECRRFLEGLLSGNPSTGFSALGGRTVQVVTGPLVSYMSDNPGLVGFRVIVLVLFGLMIRT